LKSTQTLIIDLFNALVLTCVLLPLTSSVLASDKQKQWDVLRNRIQKLQSDLDAHEKTQRDATDALQNTERSISNIYRILVKLNADKQKIDSELEQISTKQQHLEHTLKKEQDQLDLLLFQQYAKNEKNYLRILLNLDNPNQIARNMYYFQQLSRLSTETINNLYDKLGLFRSLTHSIRKKEAEITAIKAEYVKQKQKLEQEKSKHEAVLTRISKEITQQRNTMSKLTLDQNRISKLVTGIHAIFQQENNEKTFYNNRLPNSENRHNAFHTLKGKLNLPVHGKLVNRFGGQRSGKYISWKGLFIQSPIGSEIKAIANGHVVFADWLRGFGNLIIIEHSHDYMSLYGNTEAILKQVGDIVYGGDTIATVGKSGGNSDSGLYFELRHKGKAFDPLTWIKIE